MAKLILKWRYFHPNATVHKESLVRYIATREGVEKIDNSWKLKPVTKEQEKLIGELLSTFPDLVDSEEYQLYQTSSSRFTASEFISYAIDTHVDVIGYLENYVSYIAKRPHVEKQGSHGLFTDSDAPINLAAVAREFAHHEGTVFTTIMSLKREDASRLGYDNARAWRNLICSQREKMAISMNIPLDDLQWYAAFHDEGSHPHVHLIAYSKNKKPYVTQEGLERLKAYFTKEIFRQDLYSIYERKNHYRDELRAMGKARIAEIVKEIQSGNYENERIERLIHELHQRLISYKGRLMYGYLSPPCRNLINSIVDELAKDERISELYGLWCAEQTNLRQIYSKKETDIVPLSRNTEFKSIRNAILQEVALRLDREAQEPLSVFDEPIPTAEEAASEQTHKPTARQVWKKYDKAKRFLDRNEKWYDPQKAIELLKEIADVSPIACYRLGKLYLGSDNVEADVEQAKEWLTRSAEKGNAYAAYTLGKLLLTTDQEGAITWLTVSADKGFEQAEYLLGKLLYQGQFTEKNIEKAIEYLDSAVEKGNPYAAYLLGRILLTDESVKDVKEAIHYLKFAHEKGHDYAAFELGKLYLFGQDIPRDKELGMSFLQASAERGNKYASDLLAAVRANQSQAVTTGAFRLLSFLARLIEDKYDEDDREKRPMTDRKEQRKNDELKEARGQRLG